MQGIKGSGTATRKALRIEAQLRAWLLWPSRKQRDCARHQYHAADLDDPCPQCFDEAMVWQLAQRTELRDTARPTTRESSERQAQKMERLKLAKEEREKQQRRAQSIEKRAASAKNGQAMSKRRACKPKVARSAERALWVWR